MKIVLLFLLFCISLATSCTDQQYFVRINKYSGPDGNKETYTISGIIGGLDTVVLQGSSAPSNSNVTVEECISKSADGTYTLTLQHSDNLNWSQKSLITIENEDGIVVFNGNMIGSTKSFTFTLSYFANPGTSAYVKTSFDMGQWWSRDYTRDSEWGLQSLASSRIVEGNYITRYEFDLPNLASYSHLVIRVYYKAGVAVWFNNVPLFNDHLSILGDIYQWTMANAEYSSYVWKDIIVPTSMAFSQYNVLAISFHFQWYEEVTVENRFAVLAVYASNPHTQCSPIPLNIVASTGVVTTQERTNLIDRDESTSCLFYGAVTHVSFETTMSTVVSDYTIYRSGNDAATQWQLLNCQENTWPCNTWRISSQKSETVEHSGSFSYFADESTNLPSPFFRLQLFSTDGMPRNITVNEISLLLCGMESDGLMYPSRVVTVYQQVNIAPETAQTNATYRIVPDLPASLSIDASTGVISGTSTGLQSFNEFTVIRSLNGVDKKFVLIILLSENAPTVAPTVAPTTELPTEAPTETPVEPSSEPSSENEFYWIWVVVGIVMVIVLVIVIVMSVRKKTLPAQKVTKTASKK